MARSRFLLALLPLLLMAVPARSGDATKFPDYQPVPGWPKLPVGIQFGPVSAVATDSADRVFVFHRGKHPILVFERDGKYLRSWGDEFINSAHGIRIDADNNVWITDVGNHQVLKFNPDGKLLLSLGQKGKRGNLHPTASTSPPTWLRPGGEFYVSDGYGNSRVLKFSKEGKLLKQWGKEGKGPRRI